MEGKSSTPLLDSFLRITEIFNTPGLTFSNKLDRVLSVLLDFICAEQGSIMSLEKGRYLKVLAASRPELVGLRQPIVEGSAAVWVVRNRVPLFVPDISRDARFRTAERQHYKKNAFLSIPVFHQNKVVAVINATDKVGTPLLKEDTEKLLGFGSLVVSALVQQRLQEEIKKQRSVLKKRNQELRHQQTVREELSRLLIHDLKGPLAEVVANLDILSYSVQQETREFLEAAQLACDKTVRMISNLVTIGRIEEGCLQLIKEHVDPARMLAEAISGIKGLARIKNVGITLNCPAGLPMIKIDRVLILRVLQNLLTNGLGYSDPGASLEVDCRYLSEQKTMTFSVQDHGPGIPLQQQETIFEKYSRLSTKQDGLVGTGLGLYFCRLAVEAHQGKIGVTSSPGNGSFFFFTLPA